MYGYTLLFVCIYVYIWACVFVYTSVYVFICMAVFGYMYICFGLPVCAHAWLFAIGVLHGFPRLRFYFFDLDVLSLTLVIWEWMFAGRYVFRWGADCGSCAVLSVDEALLGAPRVVPWGSVGVVFNLP